MRLRLILPAAFLALLLAPAPSRAQEAPSPELLDQAAEPDSTESLSVRRLRALRRTEQLLAQGRTEEAIEFLKGRLEEFDYDREIARRLGRLYRDARRWSELEELLLAQLERGGEDQVSVRRLLAEAYFELDQPEKAEAALQRILEMHPQESSYVRMVSTTLSRYGQEGAAIATLLEGRERMGNPLLFAQQLGASYARMGRVVDAAREYLLVIVDTPMNVALMRAQILDLSQDAGELAKIRDEAQAAVDAHPQILQLRLVLAELSQQLGEPRAAWIQLEPLLDDPSLTGELLQMAMAGVAESRLPGGDPVLQMRSLQLSQRLLQGLLSGDRLPEGLQPRAYDALNRTWLSLLANPAFAGLPREEQAEVLSGARNTLLAMAERFTEDQHTTASLLRLARAYVEVLHRPQEAIPLFERIQMNPNAGVAEVQLARVGLGQAYMAAGDTLAARELFTRMGGDTDFTEGQGRAHYHLGQLDFMGGEFESAKRRLSAVAFEAPSASYTNDALDLALLLGEEMMAGPDEEALRLYGRALYHQTVGDEETRVTELQELAASSSLNLRARARYELAVYWSHAGDDAAALREIERMLTDDLGTRQIAAALELQGDIHARHGRDNAALASWERLLSDHEDYIFLDEVRDKIRALRKGLPAEPEGELP